MKLFIAIKHKVKLSKHVFNEILREVRLSYGSENMSYNQSLPCADTSYKKFKSY